MKILALETSAKAVSAAVAEDGKLLCSGYQDTGLTHSRTLMPIVEGILKNTDLTLEDIGAIAVAVGPGSFTGLRIGVSAVKGLAQAVNKPVIPVSTLEAMAWNVAHVDGLIIGAMDARRAQIYNALFQAAGGTLVRRTEDRAISLADLAEELKDDKNFKIVVGDGASLCYHNLLEHGISCRLAPPHLVMQQASSVAFVAESAARKGQFLTAQELQPIYLRPPQAERLKQS